jgi:hypothetical protein
MSSTRPNVIIGTPCYGGMMSHDYVHSLLKLVGYAPKHDFRVGLWTAAHDSLITRARNSIVAGFLDTPHATHLMFIDADIGFLPEHVHRLLRFDEDLVAGMYPVKDLDWSRLARQASKDPSAETLREAGLHFVGVPLPASEREERDGFVTGKYAGTGFMLIKRSAILRLVEAHPETKYHRMQTFPAAREQSDHQYNLFDCMIDPETKTYLSEDFTFCRRWRALGGKLWLDTESRLRHVGVQEFQGRPTFELAKHDGAD